MSLSKITTITIFVLGSLLFNVKSVYCQINLDSLWNVWTDPDQNDTTRLKAIDNIALESYRNFQYDSAFKFAQQQYNFAKSEGVKKQMANALITLGRSIYRQGDHNRAIEYFNSSLKIYEEIGDKKGTANSLNNIGITYYILGEYTSAKDYYIRSLTIREDIGDKSGIATSLNYIGLIYAVMGKQASAIDSYTHSLSINEEIGDKIGIAYSLNSIGFIYQDQGDYASAIKYYKRSLSINEEIEDKTGIASSLKSIGFIYKFQGDSAYSKGNIALSEYKYKSALNAYNQVLSISKEIGNKWGIGIALSSIGDIYSDKGNYALAHDYYTRSLIIRQEFGDKTDIAYTLNHIGINFIRQGDYAKAISYNTRSLIIAQEVGAANETRDAAKELYKAYKATNKNKLALKMHELFLSTRDSIESEKNQREIIRQEYKYDYEKKAAIDKEVNELKLQHQKTQKYFLYGGIAGLIFLTSFIFGRFWKARQQKLLIQSLNSKLSSQNNALDESAIVSIANLKGAITYVNEEFCRVSQYSRNELLGQDHRINNSGLHSKKFWKEMWDIVGKGGVWRAEVRNKAKDGSYYWVETVVSPIFDKKGKTYEYLSIRFETTDRKIMEQELASAKTVAEKATVAKSQFLATMSHEIRTPMNAIIGLTNLALKTDLNPKQKDYLEKVDRSAFSLLGIINDILDFSKIEAGKLNIENIPFDLEQVFENVSNLSSAKAQNKGLEFNIHIAKDVPFYLIGDPLRISQIITNYCSNAIKFTEKGDVMVNIELGEKLSDGKLKINFSVKDTGIGLSKEQQGKMFQEFSQADSSTTRKFGGTGLGLAISKRLAEMMGGSTWLESEQGKGSTFYFSSVLDVQEQKKREEFISPEDLKTLKVLACDDNSTARMIITEAIETFGYEVNTVESGRECIDELQKSTYDLLIIDWLMPEMDGLEVIKTIRTDKSNKNIPIIMLGIFGKEEIAKKASMHGVNHFIAKPYTYSTLFDTIMDVFGKETRRKKTRIEKGKKFEKELQKIAGSNILLAEDNEINQQVATELLVDAGFKVTIANNGKEAVDLITRSGIPSTYGLVFMDIQMPIMDGYTATEEIRKQTAYNDVPIVAMTADAMSGVKEKCLALGMNDMVTKPIDPDEMFGVMVEWIKIDPTIVKTMAGKENRTSKDKKEIMDVEIPSIKGLNIEGALKRVNNKKKLYLSILEKFYLNNQNFIIEIKTLLEKGEQETAERLIHTLKGVSGNIGADSLHENTKIVEESIHEKDSGKIEVGLNKLEVELKELFDNISVNLDFEVKSYDLGLDSELIKELIPKVKQQLKDKNPKAKVLIKDLEEAGMSGDLFEEMKSKLSKYDFKSALIVLEEIEKEVYK